MFLKLNPTNQRAQPLYTPPRAVYALQVTPHGSTYALIHGLLEGGVRVKETPDQIARMSALLHRNPDAMFVYWNKDINGPCLEGHRESYNPDDVRCQSCERLLCEGCVHLRPGDDDFESMTTPKPLI